MSAVPLCAIDRFEVVAIEPGPGWLVRADKRVDPADPHLAGHFPNLVIYPGVFIVESAYQAGLAVLGAGAALAEVRSARFLAPLTAGQVFDLEATVTPAGDGAYAVDATATRAGQRVARVRLLMRAGGAGDA